YAPMIALLGERVARHLAACGVTGRAAVDFVVVRNYGGAWLPYAIELNLRKGGTTHPFVALELLTGGSYDPASATFRTPAGARKHYVATDHFDAPELCALGAAGAIDAIDRVGLGFDEQRGTGVVMHMLAAAQADGRVGFTAIADSAPE